MSLASHLSELERKHRAIEREIEDEMSHPNTDSVRVTELKRRKLQLKDAIVRLQSTTETTLETLH